MKILPKYVWFFSQKPINDKNFTVYTIIYLSIVGIRDGGGAPGGGGKPETFNHKKKKLREYIFNGKRETKLLHITKFFWGHNMLLYVIRTEKNGA